VYIYHTNADNLQAMKGHECYIGVIVDVRADYRSKNAFGFTPLRLAPARFREGIFCKRVLFLETKEHPQISKASSWKRGRENVFLQNVLTPVAGLIFETKNRTIFLERFF